MRPQDLYRPTREYFVQQVAIVDRGGDRMPLFLSRLFGRKVLHVGCTDCPLVLTDPNLHVDLKPHVKELVGCDTDVEGIEQLKTICDGRYYSSLKEVLDSGESFDVVLAPEVLEHTANSGQFLTEFFQVPAAEHALTVPNFSYSERAEYKDGIYRELVHPDHKAWYSPYTLYNACRPYLRDSDDVELFFIGDRTTVGIWAKSRWQLL